MMRRLETWAVCAAATLLARCSGPAPAPQDGGTDAGRRDGGEEAEDSGPGGTDAGDVDASTDGEWRAVPRSEGCIEAAIDPASMPAVPIVPCPGIPDCTQIDVTWRGPYPLRSLRIMDVVPPDSGEPALLAIERHMAPNTLEILVITPDGDRVAAYRVPLEHDRCLQAATAISRNRVILSLIRHSTSTQPAAPPIIFTAALSSPADVQVLHEFTREETGSNPQVVEATDEVVGVGMVGQVFRIANDGRAQLVGGGSGWLDAAVDDAIVVSIQVPPRYIAVADRDGERPLIAPTTMQASNLKTDGRRMVWYQFADQISDIEWGTVEFFTGDYARRAPIVGTRWRDALSPAPVHDFSVVDSYLLTTERDYSLVVYSIEDAEEVARFGGNRDEFFSFESAYVDGAMIAFQLTGNARGPYAATYRWQSL